MTSHNHHHHHREHTENLKGKKLLWVTLLNFSITLVQIAGGIISNSLSLLSDAIHNLGDSSAIFIAWLAGKKGKKNQTNIEHSVIKDLKYWQLFSMGLY